MYEPFDKPTNIQEFHIYFSLASIWRRLAARFFDVFLVFLPLYYINMNPDVGNYTILITIFYIYTVFLNILQAVLLTVWGQTIGKLLFRIKIIKNSTGENGGLITNVLLREILNYILVMLIIPGALDLIFIIRQDRRCIHDFIAGTSVVDIKKLKAIKSGKLPNKHFNDNKVFYSIAALTIITTVTCALVLISMNISSLQSFSVNNVGKLFGQMLFSSPIASEDNSYNIKLVPGWAQDSGLNVKNGDIKLSNAPKNAFFITICETSIKNNMNIEDYAATIKDEISASTVGYTEVASNQIIVFNTPAKQLEIDAEQNGVKYKYLVTILNYKGKYYKLIGWTTRSRFNIYKVDFVNITNSIRIK